MKLEIIINRLHELKAMFLTILKSQEGNFSEIEIIAFKDE